METKRWLAYVCLSLATGLTVAPTCRSLASRGRGLLKNGRSGLLLIFTIFVSACATLDDRQASWSRMSAPNLIGKCFDISGRYRNAGSSASDSARLILLSELLLLEAGDEVTITQTPDTIIATSIRDGVEVSTATYNSSHVSAGPLQGWDPLKSMAFGCPLEVTTWRRDVSFNHLSDSSTGITPLGIFGNYVGVLFIKAEDGSLLVIFGESRGGLLLLVPFGISKNVWYRYPASIQP